MLIIRNKIRGFTLVEIMVVIALLTALLAITYSVAVPKWRARTSYIRSVAELNTIGAAAKLYAQKTDDFPPDVDRGVAPAGLPQLLNNGGVWPVPPYPGSLYDYDYGPDPDNPGQVIVQVSLRYCPIGDTATCKKNFPKEDFVTDAWDSYSSIYYCIKGNCRSHLSKPLNYPGYCINCGNKARAY